MHKKGKSGNKYLSNLPVIGSQSKEKKITNSQRLLVFAINTPGLHHRFRQTGWEPHWQGASLGQITEVFSFWLFFLLRARGDYRRCPMPQ